MSIVSPVLRARSSILFSASALVFSALVLVGCGPTLPSEDDVDFVDLADSIIADARAGDASEGQIELLSRARSDGDMRVELMRSAAHATVACAEAAGVAASFTEDTYSDGWVLPGYTYAYSSERSDDATDSIVSQCAQDEFAWAYLLYEKQPRALETSEAFLRLREAELRTCLEQHGYTTDSGADGVELAAQALGVLNESGAAINCLDEAGVDIVR